jgi:hypothetical protein
MKKWITLALLLTLTLPAIADRPEYERYDWQYGAKLDSLTAEEKSEGAVIMLDKRIVETAFENNVPVLYSTRHIVIRLNTDYAIEYYNKVYVPMTNVLAMEEFRARFIGKDGKAHEMNVSNVKEVENYENKGPYKIYALEGIEIGGQVEYIYTVKKEWSGFGTETYRSVFNYRKIELDIYSPDFLKYDAKSYNGLDEIETGEYKGHDDKRVLSLRSADVAGYEDESYSPSDATYPRVEYKFAYNTSAHTGRLNTWNDAASTFYSLVYSSTSNEKRMADLLLRKIGDSHTMNTEDRIRRIENYVKANFAVRSDAEGPKYEKVAGIIKWKIATDLGIMRLYAALFEQAEIDIQLVMTSDRFLKKFDGEFDSWTYLQYFLIYFPSTENFMAPSSESSRYGFIPGELCGQDGLFIKGLPLGRTGNSGYYGSGKIEYIKETSWEQNMSGLKVNITFDLEHGQAFVHSEHTYKGHSASFIQPYLNYMSAEARTEETEGVLKAGAYDAKPNHLRITGYHGEDSLYIQPLTMSGDFTTNSFLEHTCSNYIFKIGEVIGYQYAMYDEKKRMTEIALYNPHGFTREIVFEIPAGYEVSNLEALNMNYYDDSIKASMNFHSWYVRNGNTVTVTVEESYREVYYPIEMYDDFRRVMNASADFNKVVLFFDKI